MYRKLLPAGLRTGVLVCVENMFLRQANGNAPFFDPPTACPYIDLLNNEAGKQVFGFCYDVGHANLSGCDLYQDVCLLADRLICVHIHDNDGYHDQHLLPFTQKDPVSRKNCTDWEGLCAGLTHIRYQGPINLENHPALRDTPKELAKEVLTFAAATARYLQNRVQQLQSQEGVQP